MTRTKWILLTASLTLLAACSDEEVENLTEESETIEEEVEDATGDLEEETEALEEGQPVEETVPEDSETPEGTGEEEVAEETVYEPAYRVNPSTWTLLPLTEEAPANVVLLTIDDAPDNYSVEMAETLAELDVPAIFFVNGHFIDTQEEREKLSQIHELGFAIGNHTQSHANLTELSPEEQAEEILEVNETIEIALGERPRFFRAPFGENTDASFLIAEEEEMLPMNWTYGYDWNEEYMNGDALADIMTNTELLTDGAILLMHDREWSLEALPGIVEGLREKGYTFADPALIEGGNPIPDLE